MKTITVRLAPPEPPRPTTADKKAPPAPPFDTTAMAADLHEILEPQLRARFGDDVQVLVLEDRRHAIDVAGKFDDKAGKVRTEVGELLNDAFDALDMSSYAR